MRTRSKDSLAAEAAFKARLAELGAILLAPKWLGSMNPHKAICGAGHLCNPRPHDVKKGKGICRACVINLTVEASYVNKLNEFGASLVEPWRNVNIPVKIRCALGHICAPRPGSILYMNQGICRICAGNDSATAKKSFDRLITLAGGTIIDTWSGVNYPTRIKCAAGHIINPKPNSVIRGNGICHVCAGMAWDVFYVVSVTLNHRVKFGITSGNPEPRLSVHRRYGYRNVITVIETSNAREIESELLSILDMAGFTPVQGREYFGSDALPLIMKVANSYAEYGCPPWEVKTA